MMRSSIVPFAALAVASLATAAAAPEPPPKEPQWMPAFRKAYELKEGEYVRRVPAPYIKERVEFCLDAYGPPKYPEADLQNREQYKDYEKWTTLFVDQEGRKLFRRMTISSAGLAEMPQKHRGDNLFEVYDAVRMITGYKSPECIIDPAFAKHPLFEKDNLTVHGDFVVRRNTPMEKLAPQLEAILNKQCSVGIQLRIDGVEQEVIVVTGAFELKPAGWQQRKNTLDVYATEEGLNTDFDHFDLEKKRKYQGPVQSIGYSGTPADFVRFLGDRIKLRMVWEKPLPTAPNFSWNDHRIKAPDKQEEADDRDPDKVLKHATEQTGLKFTKAKRKVPVLVLVPK